ncbi:MAG: lambda exonuclease family protein [Gammaproteobacteria bacterium]
MAARIKAAPEAAALCKHPSYRDDGVCLWCVGHYDPAHDQLAAQPLQVFDCEQNSDEWYACRAGVITASEFHTVKAEGKKPGEPSATRRKYMLQLVGEAIAGVSPFDRYKSGHMERGHEYEAEARDYYSLVTGNAVQRVGFIRIGDIGCSPDGLIGDDGLHEIKTKQYDLHLECLLRDEVPALHIPQLQGGLLVTRRKWVDFTSYSAGLPIFIKRVYRDEAYIRMLHVELARFRSEMAELIAKVRGMAA